MLASGWLCALWLLGAATPAAPSPPQNPDLARAERLVGQGAYGDALQALTAARARLGNGRATLLRILELQGVSAASLGQLEVARQAFSLFVGLAPERRLDRDFGPRVMTPFYEVRAEVLAAKKTLALEEAGPSSEVQFLRWTLSDPLQLARSVRLHLRRPSGALTVQAFKPAARFELRAPSLPLDWWVTVVGDREATLAELGTPSSPLHRVMIDLTPRSTFNSRPAPKPLPPGALPTVVPESPRFRALTWALWGVGAAAGGTGAYLAISSANQRARIDSAERDSEGRIIGLGQKEAFDLALQATREAQLGNIFFISAGVLVASGVALYLFDGGVQVSPAGSVGIALSGSF